MKLPFTPLNVLGWHDVDKKLVDRLKENPKLVILFPHTSGWDAYITLLYTIFDSGIREVKDNFRLLVWDKAYNHPIQKPFFKYMNAIPVTRFEEKNGGTLKNIFNELDKLDSFILIMSPKGSCHVRPWRSGWYNIANRYDAGVTVLGMDYEKHKMEIAGDLVHIDGRSKEEMEDILKPLFSEIVPLHPEREVVKIKDHSSTSAFDYNNLLVLLIIIILLIIIAGMMIWRRNDMEKMYAKTRDTIYYHTKGEKIV